MENHDTNENEIDANGELIFMNEMDEDCIYSAALYERSAGEMVLELAADTWERDYILVGEMTEEGSISLRGTTPEGYLSVILYPVSSKRWYGDYEESYDGEKEKGFCRLLLEDEEADE